MHRGAVEASQLFLKNICVLETKPQAAHPEGHVHAIPALLIDTDIDRTECYRRSLRRLQYERVVGDQRLFVRLLALAEEVKFSPVQTDELTPLRGRRADLLAEVDVCAE